MKAEKKRKPRVLTLEEAITYDRKVMWMELRENPGQVVPVTYYAERIPFLQFDAEDRVMMISVRAEYCGKTWRCWDMVPDRPTDWEPDKEKKFQEILDSVDAGSRRAPKGKKAST